MPRAKSVGKSELYNEMTLMSQLAHENNDCAVRAVAVACGRPYMEVHDWMAARGRLTGKGTSWTLLEMAVEQFGHRIRWMPFSEIRERFLDPVDPRINPQFVTTHHPERFARLWARGTFILNTRNHVACVKEGVNHDWTKGRSSRVIRIAEITPKE